MDFTTDQEYYQQDFLEKTKTLANLREHIKLKTLDAWIKVPDSLKLAEAQRAHVNAQTAHLVKEATILDAEIELLRIKLNI